MKTQSLNWDVLYCTRHTTPSKFTCSLNVPQTCLLLTVIHSFNTYFLSTSYGQILVCMLSTRYSDQRDQKKRNIDVKLKQDDVTERRVLVRGASEEGTFDL